MRARDRMPVLLLLPLVLIGALGLTGKAAANDVLEWNAIALDVAVAGGQSPIIHSRTLTIVHLAH